MQNSMIIITAPCWQCEKEMLIALVGNDVGDFGYGPESFSEQEIKLAQTNGVELRHVDSATAEETYST
jgi:hypothetical protein